MSFYLYLLYGFIGGIIGGMGMGGGTLTIPLLTIFGGVEQKVAQCANLFAFLPMSPIALIQHAKKGLVNTQGITYILVPAMLFSLIGATLATLIEGRLLKNLFGLFLIALAIFRVFSIFSLKNSA